MQERERRGQLSFQEQGEIPNWQKAGAIIAEFLARQKNPHALFDIDGVLLHQDSFHAPTPLSDDLLRIVAGLEEMGVLVGVATSRNIQTVGYLRREHNLRLDGPMILERGHLFLNGETEIPVAHKLHTAFVRGTKDALRRSPYYRETWKHVKKEGERGNVAITLGNWQWVGKHRFSIWMHNKSVEENQQVADDVLNPIIKSVANNYGLSLENDIAIGPATHIQTTNLAFVEVAGKVGGEEVHKAIAAKHFLQKPWMFVADGFGDTPLATLTKEKKGLVVGIRGNLDASGEADAFLQNADIVMDNADEFAHALLFTGHLLGPHL